MLLQHCVTKGIKWYFRKGYCSYDNGVSVGFMEYGVKFVQLDSFFLNSSQK